MSKELCDCGKVAVWTYLPSDFVYCDDCVPRGCFCNHYHCDMNAYHPPLLNRILPEGDENVDWKWIKKDEIWTHIDEKGREYPCSEYMYVEDGWEIE
jgi:hypothetical protein